MCIAAGFADILDSKRRVRRNTQPAAGPTPPSHGSPSGDYGQPWQSQSQSPVVPQRRETSYSEPSGPVSRQSSTYPNIPPPSPTTTRIPHTQQTAPASYHSNYNSGPEYQSHQPAYYSQSPSPTHMAREDSFGPDPRYAEAGYPYTAPQQQYQSYSSPYMASSPTAYTQSPPTEHQQVMARQDHRQAAPHITPSSSSDFSQPTTPSHTSPYTPSDYNSYASHGVSSGYARQPCDTYQSQPQVPGYGQHGQQYIQVSDPNPQYQHLASVSSQPHAYDTRYAGGESNVRYEGYGDATGQAYQYSYATQGSDPTLQGSYVGTPQAQSGTAYRQSSQGGYIPGYDYQQG